MTIPENLKYSKDHIWIRVDDNIATVGITDFAQIELGDIVYVDVESVESTLKESDVFGSIEAVKTQTDLFMPVYGEVIEFNESINDNPEKINQDPYNEGWIIKINIKDQTELIQLLSATDYKKFIGA